MAHSSVCMCLPQIKLGCRGRMLADCRLLFCLYKRLEDCRFIKLAENRFLDYSCSADLSNPSTAGHPNCVASTVCSSETLADGLMFRDSVERDSVFVSIDSC